METPGKDMHDPAAEARREAARALGQARTPAKAKAARENAAARRGVPLSEEHREKIRAAQEARWEKYRAKKAEQAATLPPVEQKRRGRPRQEQPAELDTTPKRGRGRPRKETAQQPLPEG